MGGPRLGCLCFAVPFTGGYCGLIPPSPIRHEAWGDEDPVPSDSSLGGCWRSHSRPRPRGICRCLLPLGSSTSTAIPPESLFYRGMALPVEVVVPPCWMHCPRIRRVASASTVCSSGMVGSRMGEKLVDPFGFNFDPDSIYGADW